MVFGYMKKHLIFKRIPLRSPFLKYEIAVFDSSKKYLGYLVYVPIWKYYEWNQHDYVVMNNLKITELIDYMKTLKR